MGRKTAFAILLAAFVLTLSIYELHDHSFPKPSLSLSPQQSIFDVVKDEERLAETLRNEGIENIMRRLVHESGGGSIVDCHQEAHHIGRVGYYIYKEEAFRSCDASCHSGCYHGAMESLLLEKGTTNLPSTIDRVCNSFDTGFGIFECLHGVGHGLLAYVDYDLPEALHQCQSLNTDFAKQSCYGGVFMENILTGIGLGAKEGHPTEWVKPNETHFPCNAVDQNYDIQVQCYLMQTSWMLRIKGDTHNVAEECLKARADMVSICFQSLGRDIAGNTLRDVDAIVRECNRVPKEGDYHDRCLTGALHVIIDFWGPGLKNQATDLCKRLEEPFKRSCYVRVGERLKDIFNRDEEKRPICDGFESGYKALCT